MASQEVLKCEYCDKAGIHPMSNGEYYYCDEHYKPVGYCSACDMELHEDWELHFPWCGETFCRPCGKQHEETCEACRPLTDDEEESDDE